MALETSRDIEQGPTDILSLPYTKRQLIVVVDDATAATAREAEKRVEREGVSEHSGWGELAMILLRVLVDISVIPTVASAVLRTEEAKSRLKSSGLSLLHVGLSETKQFRFAPGHPREGVVYVGHPIVPELYYPGALFHRLTFEHKFAEAVRLLTSLGATRMVVHSIRGWGKELATAFSVPLHSSTSVAGSAGLTEREDNRLLFEASLDGVAEPFVPSDLVWFRHEPTWEMIAESRLKGGLREFTLNIAYEDDLGVHAGLEAEVAQVGFKLGGKFEKHEATVWKISGTFG